jgi:tetratricopeptide (TPR) repeat protein
MMPLLRAEALARNQRALASATRLQDRAGQANTLQSLGDLAMRVADLTQAAERYQAALKLFTQIDAKLGQANTLLRQADVFDAQGHLDQALKNFELALALYQSFNDTYSLAVGLGSLGELWLRNNQPEAGYRAWAQRLLLIIALDPILFSQMSVRTVNLAKNHAHAQPDQAANGCAVLLTELQSSLEQAKQAGDEQTGQLLGLTIAIFQVIGLKTLAAGQTGPEQAETLGEAQSLAQQVDAASNNTFNLAAWVRGEA